MEDQEKKERRNNIIIRALNTNGKEVKETVEKWIEEQLEYNCKVDWARVMEGRDNGLIIARMKDEGQKKEIMKKKSRLAGKRIFIDNDLTKGERKIQKEIRQLARTERGNGRKVKTGYQRINIDGKWFKWQDITKQRGMQNF